MKVMSEGALKKPWPRDQSPKNQTVIQVVSSSDQSFYQ